jgi:hypothetical protein
MIPAQRALLKTLAYADVFDYPLTGVEIKYWLIWSYPRPCPQNLPLAKLDKSGKYYYLPGRAKIIQLRQQRHYFSQLKLKKAQKLTKFLSLIPWIKMVSVTGALSMNNAREEDDIDLLIITAANRLWLTRLFLVILLELLQLRRRPHVLSSPNKVCLNLFLDEASLALPIAQRDLYTAHEVCQVKPLLNREKTYEKFLGANSWTEVYLPQATKNLKLKSKTKKDFRFSSSVLGNFFENLAFKFQYAYMRSKITHEQVAKNFAFFHPRQTSKIVLSKYQQRLRLLKLK